MTSFDEEFYLKGLEQRKPILGPEYMEKNLAAADQLETSPMPVRAAVNKLEAELALTVTPNRSIVVPIVSKERLEEILRIRTVLEGMMAEISANKISKDELKSLESLHNKVCDCIKEKKLKDFLSHNKKFHFAIYHAAKMPTSMTIVENMWLRNAPMFNFLLTDEKTNPYLNRDSTFDPVKDHFNVLVALQNGDGPAARIAIQTDIRKSFKYLKSIDSFN